MFNSSLTFTSFILFFSFTGLAQYDWMQVETGMMQYWTASVTLWGVFLVILEGITAGRQRNPVININILSPHKYFSGCYDVRVCSFFKGSVTSFVEIAWMVVPRMWLPSGTLEQGDQTFKRRQRERKRDEAEAGCSWWRRVKAENRAAGDIRLQYEV